MVEDAADDTKVTIKLNKNVSSSFLQNPSDPDADYNGHKEKGYQTQVVETYFPDKSQSDLITHVNVESTHESDGQALLPAIEDVEARELSPTKLLADSLYGGDENVENARKLGVEDVAPTMDEQSQEINLADFHYSEPDEIISCPTSQVTQRTKTGKSGGKIIHFDKATCDLRPPQSDCPVKLVKQSATISYDAKALRLARRWSKEMTAAFREAYRYRVGIEETMSYLDRLMGIKHLRVRGMMQVRVAATLKATGA